MYKNATISKLCISLVTIALCNVYALKPNPIISRNKTIYGLPSDNIGILVNGKFGENWNVSNGSWVAIKLGGNYSKILLNWNNTGGSWSDSIAAEKSCKSGSSIPVDYDILKSSNSTNGSDGEWASLLTIRNNVVTARSHSLDFDGAQWVKMSIIKGGGSLDEVEVFDITNGDEDTWFFPGTSITAVSFKSTVPDKNFADLITEKNPTFSPAFIRGGIGCITSTNVADDISKYLNVVRNVKHWAIEMGTNDAWGGGNYFVPTFTKNLQLIIDSCKANNIQPVIARIIGTDSAKVGWQVHPDFLKAIDSLTIKNNLLPGPDLYTYFSRHGSELYDGIHPNVTGGANVYRLWAEKMDTLYKSAVSITEDRNGPERTYKQNVSVLKNGRSNILHVKCAGTLSIYTLNGSLLKNVFFPSNGLYNFDSLKGIFIVKFSSVIGNEVTTISNIN
jgi:lysophospholipase L1-like esterase